MDKHDKLEDITEPKENDVTNEPGQAAEPDDQDIVEAVQEDAVDVEALLAEVETLRQEAQSNFDGWQRARAEFSNYKRRTTQELATARQRGVEDAMLKILPILDNFERALANIPDDLTDNPWASGTALILKDFQKVLDEFDIHVIDPVGEEFDPTQHEAVGMDPSDEYESGIVTTTLQKGYRSKERILRSALVRVAS